MLLIQGVIITLVTDIKSSTTELGI